MDEGRSDEKRRTGVSAPQEGRRYTFPDGAAWGRLAAKAALLSAQKSESKVRFAPSRVPACASIRSVVHGHRSDTLTAHQKN